MEIPIPELSYFNDRLLPEPTLYQGCSLRSLTKWEKLKSMLVNLRLYHS